MRICVIIDAWEPIWGGGQTHVWEISKRIVQKYGLYIDIYTRSLILSDKTFYPREESYFDGKLRILRVGPTQNVFSVWGRGLWVVEVIWQIFLKHLRYPYAIIHSHAYISAIPGKLLQFLLHVPLAYTVHGSHNLDIGKKDWIAIFERILLTQISYDTEITVSRRLFNYSNINKNIVYIANGVDTQNFDEVFSTKNKVFTFLWVGRFDWIKGVDILLYSFSQLVQKKKDVRLLLVGYGYDEKKYKLLARRLKIEKKVRFLGKKSAKELVKVYKSADVFVLPSLAEGQAITLFEAWAAKLPVIVSDAGDHKWIVKNGTNGYVVKSGDEVELTKTMEKIMVQRNLEDLGNNGYRLVKTYFTWNKSARKVNDTYQKLKQV